MGDPPPLGAGPHFLILAVVHSSCCPSAVAGTVNRMGRARSSARLDGVARAVDRLRRLPPTFVDAGIGVLFLALEAAELTRQRPAGGQTMLIAAAALTLVLAACLIVRRRVPVTAYVVGTAALVTQSFLHVATMFSPLATLIGAYSMGLYATPTRARWGPLLVTAGVVSYFLGTPGLGQIDPAQLAYVLLVWLAGWALGYSTARRRQEQDQARRALQRQVIAEERIRMSRELHDLVGHTVNLLVVQAGAARLTLDRDPATTRELLTGMEQTGRETLAELDRVLATLRADSAEAGPGPPPVNGSSGLARLPELVERFTDSGVDVQLTVDPDLRLPRDLDLAAYRIVQEALTNALKHAAPCAATVAVRRDDGSVIIEVCDTGPGRRDSNAGGRGLLGIAERVSLSGGRFEHGNGDRGGFRLSATLPLP
ncbi:MAG TPA: sensor histidine kinase [Propionibacteriaceae bacterium]|nr:sensor histidine kinase [Propionibacteriaceae bacterium]